MAAPAKVAGCGVKWDRASSILQMGGFRPREENPCAQRSHSKYAAGRTGFESRKGPHLDSIASQPLGIPTGSSLSSLIQH